MEKDKEFSEEELNLFGKVGGCIAYHMMICEDWQDGNPVEYEEEDGVYKVRYESGKWWHYKLENNRVVWW